MPITATCRGAWCTSCIDYIPCGLWQADARSYEPDISVAPHAMENKPCLCPQGAVRGPQPGRSNRHSVRPMGQGHISQRAPYFGYGCLELTRPLAIGMQPVTLHVWSYIQYRNSPKSVTIGRPNLLVDKSPTRICVPTLEPEPLPVCTHRPWCRR